MQTNKLIHTSKEEAQKRAERAQNIGALLITVYKLIIPIILANNERIIGKKILGAINEAIKANNLPFLAQMDARYNTDIYVPLFIYPNGSGRAQIVRLFTPSNNKRLRSEQTIEELNKHINNIPSQVARYIDAYENYEKYVSIADELKAAIDKYNESANNLICYKHYLR